MADSPAEVLEIFKGLGSYSLTLFVGLMFMIFVFYPLVITSFIKKLSYKRVLQKHQPRTVPGILYQLQCGHASGDNGMY